MRDTNLITTKKSTIYFQILQVKHQTNWTWTLNQNTGMVFFLHSLIKCFPVYIEINQYSSNHLPIFNSKFLYQYQTEESRTE